MGQFVGHESCPSCGSRDNLARYDDGGAFCFGCHYKERATHAPLRSVGVPTEDDQGLVRPLPDDIGHDFRSDAVTWLGRYYVDVPTAIRNGLVWSPSREQLIYQLGNCWQARNFRKGSRSKNFTSGDVNGCLHIYSTREKESMGGTGESGGRGQGSEAGGLVIVEDPLSAIRIASAGGVEGPWWDSMPLLGSHLAAARLHAVAGLYGGGQLMFWLDSDKYKEARGMEQRAKYMGLSARTIYTELDPKEYDNATILEILK